VVFVEHAHAGRVHGGSVAPLDHPRWSFESSVGHEVEETAEPVSETVRFAGTLESTALGREMRGEFIVVFPGIHTHREVPVQSLTSEAHSPLESGTELDRSGADEAMDHLRGSGGTFEIDKQLEVRRRAARVTHGRSPGGVPRRGVSQPEPRVRRERSGTRPRPAEG